VVCETGIMLERGCGKWELNLKIEIHLYFEIGKLKMSLNWK